MRKIVQLFLLATLLLSCKEEMQYTGDLVVSSGGKTTIGSTPIGDIEVGLFDISELQEPFAYPDHALEIKSFVGGKIEFKGLNPGNYVVARIYADDLKPVQVRVGQTTTLELFQ